MASSFSISNPEVNSNQSRESKRKKRRKIESENQNETFQINRTKWRTQAEQHMYSSKFIEALLQVRRNTNSQAISPASGRTVRETADRVLAVSAKGRTRWSRAILTSRLSLRMNISKHKKSKKAKVTGYTRSTEPMVKKRMPALQRKVRVLGRLVPGCRKLSFPNLLEEATDYIAALEMQVRAMAAISSLLTGSGPVSLAASSDRVGSNLP